MKFEDILKREANKSEKLNKFLIPEVDNETIFNTDLDHLFWEEWEKKKLMKFLVFGEDSSGNPILAKDGIHNSGFTSILFRWYLAGVQLKEFSRYFDEKWLSRKSSLMDEYKQILDKAVKGIQEHTVPFGKNYHYYRSQINPRPFSIVEKSKKFEIMWNPARMKKYLHFHGFGIDKNQVLIVDRETHLVDYFGADQELKSLAWNKGYRYISEQLLELPEYVEDNIPSWKILNTFENTGANILTPKFYGRLDVKPFTKVPCSYNVDYKYFQNGFLEITMEKICLLPYSHLPDIGMQYRERILGSDYDPGAYVEPTKDNNIFYRFCSLAVAEGQLAQLFQAIGYLLHENKDPALAKAVVIIDPIATLGQKKGRLGKDIILNYIVQPIITPDERARYKFFYYLDGQTLKDNQFSLQGLTPKHIVLYLADTRENFPYNILMNLITGAGMIENKWKDRFSISHKDLGKFALNSQYIFGDSGRSIIERLHVVELSEYFADKSPKEVFNTIIGGTTFEEVPQNQQKQLVDFIVYCTRLFLRDGLITDNDKFRQHMFDNETHPVFTEVMENLFLNGNGKPKIGVKITRTELKNLLDEATKKEGFSPGIKIFQEKYYDFDKLREMVSKWSDISGVKFLHGYKGKYFPFQHPAGNIYTLKT